MRRRSFAGLGLLLCLGAHAAWSPSAAAADLEPKQQALLALRVLAYDRNLKTRTSNKAAYVVVLYQEGNPASETARVDLLGAFEDLVSAGASLGGLPLKVLAVAYAGAGDLDGKLTALRPAALFVCPGIGDAVATVYSLTRKRATLTLTSTPGYVKLGLSVGLLRGEERPVVLINLAATRAEGADLDAALLRVSEVIR